MQNLKQSIFGGLLLLTATVVNADAADMPLFDVHVHYSDAMARELSPAQVIEWLNQNNIRHAAVIGMPQTSIKPLQQQAPGRIVPVLSVYRSWQDKQQWHQQTALPQMVQEQLKSGKWAAVGELHLFAGQRYSPVFIGIAQQAAQYDVPLMLHTDPAVIDTVFKKVPDITVIWAHAGAYPYPPLLRDYLQRYPNLYIDLSVREASIMAGGRLKPDWEALFFDHSDRFMVGVDTYSITRWQQYSDVVLQIRKALQQLPQSVAQALASANAEKLFHKWLNP